MEDAGAELDWLASAQADRVQNNKDFANELSKRTNGNATAVATASLLEAMLDRADARATAKANAKKLAALKPEVEKLKMEQRDFLKEALSLPNNADLLEIIQDVDQSDTGLTKIINSADNSQKTAFYAIKNANAGITLSNLNQINSALSTMSGANGVTPQSATINSGGNQGGTIENCSAQAKAAWMASTEYIKYQNTKLNADASLCKAKIIDLTIQFCRSKLSPKEIAEYERISAEEKQTAKNLSTGGFNYVK